MKLVAEISKDLVERLLCSGPDADAPDYPFIVEGNDVFLRYDEIRVTPEKGATRIDFCSAGRVDATWTPPEQIREGTTFRLAGLEGRLSITVS